ncbi:MAG: tetratricopeptide repeat protein [Candidatus Scalindua sp.]
MEKVIKLLIILIFSMIFSGCLGMQYNTGESYLEQEKYPEAINAFKTVLEQNPEYPNAHTQLGIAYYRTGMHEQAISELKAAKELRFNDKRARLFLGMAYLKYGKTDDAIEDTIVEWESYRDMFPLDNMSGILQKSIVVLKSGEILPATVDLMTSSIETAIAQEDRDRDAIYPDRYRSFEYRYPFFRHGYYPCD